MYGGGADTVRFFEFSQSDDPELIERLSDRTCHYNVFPGYGYLPRGSA